MWKETHEKRSKPSIKENELLIRVYATSVTMGDVEMRSLKFPFLLALAIRLWLGFWKPKTGQMIGQEFSGQVEAVGKEVKGFKEGDEVFGTTLGAYAEYIALPETRDEGVIGLKPSNLTYEEAAAILFGGFEALYFLKKANLQAGQKLLIIGAGGSIGSAGIQLGKYFGAEVTAVDRTEKLEMMRSIGADKLIDFTKNDFSKLGETYDVIFDVAGKTSLLAGLKVLKPKGIYLLTNPRLSTLLQGFWTNWRSDKRVVMGATSHTIEDLLTLKELAEKGDYKAVIDRRYPLEQIVEAHRYVESGMRKGNLVITV
jgi:NADPH:quinone reductase-like Zn-dependent oxidoreductase